MLTVRKNAKKKEKAEVKFVPYNRLLKVIFRPSRPRNEEELEKLRESMERALKTLTYREREIIKLRYGLGDGHVYTFEEIRHIFKVSAARVRQIHARAMKKLRNPLRSRLLEGFLESFKK